MTSCVVCLPQQWSCIHLPIAVRSSHCGNKDNSWLWIHLWQSLPNDVRCPFYLRLYCIESVSTNWGKRVYIRELWWQQKKTFRTQHAESRLTHFKSMEQIILDQIYFPSSSFLTVGLLSDTDIYSTCLLPVYLSTKAAFT